MSIIASGSARGTRSELKTLNVKISLRSGKLIPVIQIDGLKSKKRCHASVGLQAVERNLLYDMYRRTGALWDLVVGSHVVATHYVTVKFPSVGFMSAKSHS